MALALSQAHAQIEVSMKPEERTFVAHSPVFLKVTITNRSGKAITLTGPNARTGWLNFRVLNAKQDMVTSRRGAPIAQPLTIPASNAKTLRVNLNEAYPVNRFGNYQVTANVYDPNSRTFVSSRPQLLTIDEAKTIWKQTEAVGGGKKATFSLLSYRGYDRTKLYFRLTDANTGFIRKTYSLGDLIQYKAPQAAVDKSHRVHVLYQAAPRQYVHDIIGSDGNHQNRKVYEEDKGSRPELLQSRDGSVRVAGGINPKVKSQEKREKLKDLARIRRLSDRPPGF